MSREQSSRDILYGSSGPEVLISVICIHFAAEPATIQDSPDHLGLLVIRNGVVRLHPLNDLGIGDVVGGHLGPSPIVIGVHDQLSGAVQTGPGIPLGQFPTIGLPLHRKFL